MTDNATNSLRPAAETMLTPKQEWRKRIRARRRERRAEQVDSARERERAALASYIDDIPGIESARTVTSFEPMPTEPDVTDLNAALIARGIRVLVPITCEDLDLEWRVLGTSQTEPGNESMGKDAIGEADVVIVPALAISEQGGRLGQGGGCYDRALPRRAAQTPVVSVVFAHEVVPDLPTESHDEWVDAALTEEGIRRFR